MNKSQTVDFSLEEAMESVYLEKEVWKTTAACSSKPTSIREIPAHNNGFSAIEIKRSQLTHEIISNSRKFTFSPSEEQTAKNGKLDKFRNPEVRNALGDKIFLTHFQEACNNLPPFELLVPEKLPEAQSIQPYVNSSKHILTENMGLTFNAANNQNRPALNLEVPENLNQAAKPLEYEIQ